MKFIQNSLAIFCLLNNINPYSEVKADQPVHCLREQLFGIWNFHVSKESQVVNLFDTNELCTHRVPNKVQLVNKDHQFTFQSEDIYRVNLLENYQAEAVFCPAGKKCGSTTIKGHWTSIYDQAFNVELENGMRFLANYRYNIKPSISKDPFVDARLNGISQFTAIESGDYDKFDSQCGKTMIGFVQNMPSVTGVSHSLAAHKVQCFHATQEKHYDIEKTQAFNTGKVKYNKIIQHKSVTPDKLINETPKFQVNAQLSSKSNTKKRQNLHLEHEPSDEMDLLISAVNEADLGWKADTCKYQKHHALYGAHCDKGELKLAQIKNDDLVDTDAEEGKKFGDMNDKQFVATLNKAQSFQKKYQSANQIPDSELPESLDWRNVDGYDFTSYFRDQGHCGSCYTISFTQVMEARLKLKYGQQPPQLSPQMLMTCNYMNEGCDGGWPHFNVFLAENGHLVSEECAPYQSRTKGDSCKNYEKCQPVAKVQKSYLVGGGWGATSEKKMMKEILRNGPINGDFQAPSMFSIYKEGIFREKGLLSLKEKSMQNKRESLLLAQTSESGATPNFSDVTLNDKGISWMDMNHSVVIVGWGQDKKTGTRYWIVRNSYGQKWGMNGDFLVQRGNNDFGMEVEQIAFEPSLCSEDSTDVCNLV